MWAGALTAMKLLTKEIEKHLTGFGGEDSTDKPVIVKFFTPWAGWTWYVSEGQKQEDGDVLFFGYVRSGLGSDCNELGYFTLHQLLSARGPDGIRVERDRYFGRHTLRECMAAQLWKG